MTEHMSLLELHREAHGVSEESWVPRLLAASRDRDRNAVEAVFEEVHRVGNSLAGYQRIVLTLAEMAGS